MHNNILQQYLPDGRIRRPNPQSDDSEQILTNVDLSELQQLIVLNGEEYKDWMSSTIWTTNKLWKMRKKYFPEAEYFPEAKKHYLHKMREMFSYKVYYVYIIIIIMH